MITILLCLLFCNYLIATDSLVLSDSSDKLLYVSVLTTHGMITPIHLYPSDPYRSRSYWPEGVNVLTAEGVQEMKTLGTILRKRYEHLPENYTSDSLTVRSINTNHSLKSASELLSGLYPDESIPIFSTPIDCDDLFFSHKKCPAYNQEIHKILNSDEYRMKDNQRHNLYKFLSYHLGQEVDTLENIHNIYMNFEIEKMRGLKLPKWTTVVYPEPLSELAGKFVVFSTETELSTKFRHGPLINDILTSAINIDANDTFKTNMYSADDITIGGILAALKLYDGTPPGFSSALLLEVYWNSTELEKYLRIFYRVDYSADFVELSIPDCEDSCSLNFIMEYLESVIPKNISFECKRQFIMDGDVFINRGSNVISSLVILSACLGSAALGALLIIFVSRVYKTITYDDNDNRYFYKKINNSIKHKNRYKYESI